MEYYAGITDSDKLKFGGSYVEENNHGGEQHNFKYHNGYYYGFVNTGSTRGVSNQMHIERIQGGNRKHDTVEDVLIIWTAKDGNKGVKIVGWYNEARVFRYYEEFTTIDLLRPSIIYNIKARAENCTLLALDERSFNVPRARASRNGIGMGQSNIWYADREEARSFVDRVVNYVESYDGEKLNLLVGQKELDRETQDSLATNEEYIDKAYELTSGGENIKAIQYCNRVLKDQPTNIEANNCKGNALLNLDMFDEAIRYYNKALKIDEDVLRLYFNLGLAHGFKGDSERALEYFNKVLEREEDPNTLAFKSIALINLNRLEEGENAISRAKEIAPDIEWFDYLIDIYDSIP